ncbi:MAG: HU family DNA-binding protein [Deltaproteobacteria bacterium]|nr:HU family DNA-binding protein [Deltaproteobacteria bacterium]MBW1956976.1 HU family DNA-binding protein [Deltaproteobacteria bacterium]MBW2012287.1 HU family DNA-binding protein [Deltaproteobacteria bacterium]MBW2089217.1 HU family DNA-binding protein [Deltaproteobacteria bacterium]MBW2321000.1 HU family DNA-binding protein [Deltaproteobacteria bacterium]
MNADHSGHGCRQTRRKKGDASGSPRNGRRNGWNDVNLRRKASKGRNPQTGEAVKIKASTIVKFKAGKKLQPAIQ